MIIKKIALGILTGANIVSALLLVATAYSDHVNPVSYPRLACIGMVFPIMVVINLVFIFIWAFLAWRRMWITVVALIVSYPAIRVFLPLHLTEDPPEGCLKVLTYNVCGYTGNKDYDGELDSICDYIVRQDADIVCVQEDNNSKTDPVERWQELYSYNDTMHTNPPTSSLISAIGFHSRFPILKRERIDYESKSNASVAYFLLINGDTVIVINNHLESTHLSPDDRRLYKDMLRGEMGRQEVEQETRHLINKLADAMAIRARQADAVHEYIETHRQWPIIVCGDFNDTPISYTRRTIAQGLLDCFVETGSGLGLSYNQKGFNFRIDHILCSEHYVPFACQVDSKMEASDHYPVFCWLKMVDKP